MKEGEKKHLCRGDTPTGCRGGCHCPASSEKQAHSAFLMPSRENTAMAKRFQTGLFSGPLDGRDAWYSSTVWDHFIGWPSVYFRVWFRICHKHLYQPAGLLRVHQVCHDLDCEDRKLRVTEIKAISVWWPEILSICIQFLSMYSA